MVLDVQIDELSSFSDTPAPSVTRILYTDKDVLARKYRSHFILKMFFLFFIFSVIASINYSYVKQIMTNSGLSVREDAVGNIFGRWQVWSEIQNIPQFHLSNQSIPLFFLCVFFFSSRQGYEAGLAPVSTGSHIDAIPYSGKYDGVVGVLGALEAINILKRFKSANLTELFFFK